MNKKSKKNSYMQEEHVSLSDYWYFKNNNKIQIKNNLNIFRPIKKLIKIFFEKFFNISSPIPLLLPVITAVLFSKSIKQNLLQKIYL